MPRSSGVKKEGAKVPSKAPAGPRPKRTTKTKMAPPLEIKAIQERVMPRMLELYRNEVRPALIQEQGYRNLMEAPRLKKVVLNVGLAEALQNPKAVESATRDIAAITGQKPVTTRAHKPIAAFKLRKGMPIGVTVTLRGTRMYDFLDRLTNAALPRIRDFRGMSRNSFDGQGNFSLGIREQVIFPEVDYNQIDRVRGFQVSIVTTARSNGEALRLLELMGMPFTRSPA